MNDDEKKLEHLEMFVKTDKFQTLSEIEKEYLLIKIKLLKEKVNLH